MSDMQLFPEVSDAVLSPDGLYRYWLRREWGAGPTAVWVMCNPSTADATADDPTIRRCINFSKRGGCGALEVVNLYGWRATDPSALRIPADPEGPANRTAIAATIGSRSHQGGPVIAAWGATPAQRLVGHLGPHVDIIPIAEHAGRQLVSLGTTREGHPRHPLYVASTTPLTPWPEAA